MAFEINLLDNASGEDLDDLAVRVPNCRTFTAPTNLGFGGGHNLLAAETDAQYLLILNPDVEFLFPDTVRRLLLPVAGADRVKAVGPKLLTAAGQAQPYDHGRLHGLRAEIALKGGHSYWRQTGTRQEVAWVSGAAMLVERATFVGLGGFDEKLFLYKEDEDLCLRVREVGGQVIYEPAAAIRHHRLGCGEPAPRSSRWRRATTSPSTLRINDRGGRSPPSTGRWPTCACDARAGPG